MALNKCLEVLPDVACHTVENFRDKAVSCCVFSLSFHSSYSPASLSHRCFSLLLGSLQQVQHAIKAVLMSKQHGLEDFLAELVTDVRFFPLRVASIPLTKPNTQNTALTHNTLSLDSASEVY